MTGRADVRHSTGVRGDGGPEGPEDSADHDAVPDSGPATARAPRWWPVLVPVVIVLVGAWLYRWVDEDAFINFRIIDNLFAGHGLVFNVGERVEAEVFESVLQFILVLERFAGLGLDVLFEQFRLDNLLDVDRDDHCSVVR